MHSETSKRIGIPEKLMRILEHDRNLAGGVLNSLAPFEMWIDSGGLELPFFPEYTDHGLRHVSNVLETISSLIHEESYSLLTPQDACVIILATVLHDSAMHLKEDGFLTLINSSYSEYNKEIKIDKPWFQTWQTFLSEARRWDGQTLNQVIGDTANGELIDEEQQKDLAQYIKPPQEMGDPDRWSRKYRKFLGEFIRRNHGRFSHDLALFGMPGPGKGELNLDLIPKDITDIAGLVARSHSMNIRDTFDYLYRKYHGRVLCRNTHPVYLMALLRISDYLDIKADRAPSGMLGLRRLRSPISASEWNTHFSIQEIRPDEQDKEAIFVDARPQNASSFLKIRRLLAGLQLELDISWAILGEVYSKQDDLNLHKLLMTLRRIRSNLDDVGTFSETVKYYPLDAAFGVADADILKLLIRPLYGDSPEIGIRELLQNSVDAVRELREYYQNYAKCEEAKWPTISDSYPDADVIIEVTENDRQEKNVPEDWEYWIKVTDRGIGMNSEIVCKFFLKAGASFRNSDAWRKEFLDSQGKSKILRSGRFGIGILATFLLGDRIQVLTKHIESSDAISFAASIDDRELNLLKKQGAEIGTTIWVKINEETYDHLTNNQMMEAWDWYCTTDVKVERLITAENLRLKQKWKLLEPKETPLGEWRMTNHPRYSQIYWTYRKVAPKICCNGILVEKNWSRKNTFGTFLDPYLTFIIPRMSIFDPDGALPLNLQRTELKEEVIKSDVVLMRDILNDFFAYVLTFSPNSKIFESSSSEQEYSILKYSGLTEGPKHYGFGSFGPWISSKEGAVLLHPWYINKCKINRLFFFFRGFGFPGDMLNLDSSGIIAVLSDAKSFVTSTCAGKLLTAGFPFEGIRVFTKKNFLKNIFLTSSKETPTVTRNSFNENWVIYEQGITPSVSEDLRDLVENTKNLTFTQDTPFVIEAFLKHDQDSTSESLLTQEWENLKLPNVIPYDVEIRKKVCNFAFKRLGQYMSLWEKSKASLNSEIRKLA